MPESSQAAAQLVLALAIIAGAIVAVFRRIDVRLAIGGAGLLLGIVSGSPAAVVRAFMASFVDPKTVIPICFAMGFAFVLKETRCDQHLVQLLVVPLRRARLLVVPGTVLVGFLVNIPIVSQTGTAASVGPVLIPLLFAMRVAPVAAGAALLIGCSIGGELMNPGGTQYGAITKGILAATGSEVSQVECVEATQGLNLTQLMVATLVLTGGWLWSEQRAGKARPTAALDPIADEEPFRINYAKALVPVLPLVLLFLVSPPTGIFELPAEWLVGQGEDAGLFSSRLVGAAMLVGFVVATAISLLFDRGSVVSPATRAFFDGLGFGFREIISIIAVAACFSEGVLQVGIGKLIQHGVTLMPQLLLPVAGYLTMAFAVLCGSGIAATKGLFDVFAASALQHGFDPLEVGAVMAICADAGRTMSPVAAVTLMCARLTGTEPLELVKRVAPPLVAGVSAAILVAIVRS
ncbi:MAG: C4-dicarboxylate transporter DcuC [Planctomycetaceae bacterium]|nr:C4-dicarboxylate transporter DcuC [Planctomycetaceae bacterium]